MKAYINIINSLLVLTLTTIFISCQKNQSQIKEENYFLGLEFGMTRAEVDSIFTNLGIAKINEQENRASYKGTYMLLNKEWNWAGVIFDKDSLCEIEFQDWFNCNSEPRFDKAANGIRSTLNVKLDMPEISHFGGTNLLSFVSGNKKIVAKAENQNGTMSLVLLPYTENNEKQLVRDATNKAVEKYLKDITEAYAAYLKADNSTIRNMYANDVTKYAKFLDAHYSDMTEKQKEYYQKIRNL